MSNLYAVTAVWPRVTDTPATIGSKFLATLDKLSTMASWLSDWVTSDRENDYLISDIRNSMAEWVASRVFIGDLGQVDAENGYSVHAISNASGAWPFGCTTSLGVHAASTSELSNFVQFQVGARPPRETDPAFITFDLYKAALLAIIDIWPSYWANASCYPWGDKPPMLPGEEAFPYSTGFQMPWFSYLSREAAGGLVPPAGIEAERTSDGGVLMIATRERLDPFNAKHRQLSRLLLEVMLERKGGLGR